MSYSIYQWDSRESEPSEKWLICPPMDQQEAIDHARVLAKQDAGRIEHAAYQGDPPPPFEPPEWIAAVVFILPPEGQGETSLISYSVREEV